MAALLYAGDGARLTGCAAAARLGWHPAWFCELVRVMVPARRRRQSRDFVHITRTRVDAGLTHRGMDLAKPARILVDCGRDLTTRSLTAVTAKALQRREVRLPDLQRLVLEHPRLPGAAIMRGCLLELGGGAESIKEVDCRVTFRRLNYPEPVSGIGIYVGDRLIAVPDFWWEGVAGFYDGATHLDRESQIADGLKRTELEALGIQVVLITSLVLADEVLLQRRLDQAFMTAKLQSGPRGWRAVPLRPTSRSA